MHHPTKTITQQQALEIGRQLLKDASLEQEVEDLRAHFRQGNWTVLFFYRPMSLSSNSRKIYFVTIDGRTGEVRP